MQSPITVAIHDCAKSRFRELEHFIGTRLYRKGTDTRWFVDYHDREAADMVVANLNAGGYQAQILGDPEPPSQKENS